MSYQFRSERRRRRAHLQPNRWLLIGATVLVVLSVIASGAFVAAGIGRLGGTSSAPGNDPRLAVVAPGAVGSPAPTPAGVAALTGPTSAATAPAVAPPSVTAGATPPSQAVAAGATTGKAPIVCLDVGHGGVDLGNVRTSADGSQILAQEKDILLAQALALKPLLEARGITVVMTRTTDTEVNPNLQDVNGDGEVGTKDLPQALDELQARINICNNAGADLLVSMHANSADNTALRGYEVWWSKDTNHMDASSRFARTMELALGDQFTSAGFQTIDRGAADDSMLFLPSNDQGTLQHLAMTGPDVPGKLVGSTMPSVIVECLFLSNADDSAFLVTPQGQDAIVAAYAEAIGQYFADRLAPQSADRSAPRDNERVVARISSDHGATPPSVLTPAGAGGQTVAFTAATGVTPTPRPAPPAATPGAMADILTGTSGRKEIALTFDAGADRGDAVAILDTLKAKGIHATFGMTGVWAEENPDLVRRMVADGHQLINHTYDHRSFTGRSVASDPADPNTWQPLTTPERIDEVNHTNQIIMQITGGYDTRPYFRPPYGDIGPISQADMVSQGYYVDVLWDVDSNGWNHWPADKILNYCLAKVRPGSIILMHIGQRSQDYLALPDLIDQLATQGYTFVTVEQLLQA